jgi:excisionase family DNA binding protein
VTFEENIARIVEEVTRRVVREEIARSGPDVMTVEQAAAHTGRSPKTIRGWITEGLPVTRKGRRVHIKREDLAAWMTRGERTSDAIVASLRRGE